MQRGETQQFDDDLVVRFRPFGAGIADVDAARENRAVDADEALAVSFKIGPDELLGGALDDLDNLADPLPRSPGLAMNSDQDFVAVDCVESVMGGDKELD